MVLTVRTGRDDVFSLLEAWFKMGVLLRVDFEFVRFASTTRVRMRDLTPDRIDFISDVALDSRTEISLPLPSDFTFGIGHFRHESPDDRETYGRCVSIYCPVPNAEPEYISLIEVKERS